MDHVSDQRIGDDDRALAFDRLGHYFADGYLDVTEFEERTAKAAVARTRKEMAALFADLPAQSAASADVVAAGPAPDMRAQRELDEVMERGRRIQRWDGVIWVAVLITFFVGAFVVGVPFSWVVFPLGAFASWGMRSALKVDDADEKLFAELNKKEREQRAERLRKAAERRRELGQ